MNEHFLVAHNDSDQPRSLKPEDSVLSLNAFHTVIKSVGAPDRWRNTLPSKMVALELDGLVKQLAMPLAAFGPRKKERALTTLVRGIPDQRDKSDEEKQDKFNHADSLLDAKT